MRRRIKINELHHNITKKSNLLLRIQISSSLCLPSLDRLSPVSGRLVDGLIQGRQWLALVIEREKHAPQHKLQPYSLPAIALSLDAFGSYLERMPNYCLILSGLFSSSIVYLCWIHTDWTGRE